MFHDIIIMALPSEYVFIIIYALITPFATIGIIYMCYVHYCSLHEVYAVSCIACQLYICCSYTIYKYICKKNECVNQPFSHNVT